jgi:small GTP-binding protein
MEMYFISLSGSLSPKILSCFFYPSRSSSCRFSFSSMQPQGDTFKVVLAGNHQSGKTLFMHRWKDPTASADTVPTVGTELMCQTVDLNGVTYRVQLWDTAGQEAYHSITAPYFRSCKGVFLVFDLTNRASFEALGYWLKLIEENCNHVPLIVIIANKNDLPNREVELEAVAQFCRENELQYFVTSALTGENVENAANHMLMTLAGGRRKRVETEKLVLDGGPRPREGCC